jgi:hypothetical protein
MEKVNLSEETIKGLAIKIVEQFFLRCENLLVEKKDAGLLGLLFQDHLEQVQKRRDKEEKEKRRAQRKKRIDEIPNPEPHFPSGEADNLARQGRL